MPWWSAILGVIGIGAHLLVNGFFRFVFFVSLGTTAATIIGLSMLAVLVIGLRLRIARRHPWALLALPVIGFLLMLVIVIPGQTLLGWQPWPSPY